MTIFISNLFMPIKQRKPVLTKIHIYVINNFLANRVVNWEKKDNSVLV